jgi:hypothetical protein
MRLALGQLFAACLAATGLWGSELWCECLTLPVTGRLGR